LFPQSSAAQGTVDKRVRGDPSTLQSTLGEKGCVEKTDFYEMTVNE
jgi:hypothetical protein